MSDSSSKPLTEMTVINVAKGFTIICLMVLALIYGISDQRQVIYLCLHIGYCLWWLLEQWLLPARSQQLFTEKMSYWTLIPAIAFVGVFYALPGYFAFTNPEPIGLISVGIALPLFMFGSLINTAADVQKMVAKEQGVTLVQDGAWRYIRHINYLGDLMRYSSFAVVAGVPWAFLVSGVIFIIYVGRIKEKEVSMADKYEDFAVYKSNSVRLIPFLW